MPIEQLAQHSRHSAVNGTCLHTTYGGEEHSTCKLSSLRDTAGSTVNCACMHTNPRGLNSSRVPAAGCQLQGASSRVPAANQQPAQHSR
eukprot:1160056-Pelagomonas_calceolata.AAC.9